MTNNRRLHTNLRILLLNICMLLCMTGMVHTGAGAQDTANKVTIHIIKSGYGGPVPSDSGQTYKLIGDVQLEQNGTYMYCDSAYLNQEKNNMEAFGNVRIIQPGGTQVQSDYLRYTGNNKHAYLKGNASLTDGKNNLWCEELNYDVGTKIGTYDQGGTLQSESTTVSSNSGTYDVNKKDARFTGEVFITDPQYNVTSDDLGYNTNTKFVRFFGPSVVTNDKSVLRTSSGTWDSKSEIAHFVKRSSLLSDAQYIEADSMDYNRKTGFGNAKGNVIALDTVQQTTLYSGYAEYNEITKTLRASIKPVMKKKNGDDSLYIRADTFFSAPVPRPGDTLRAKAAADSIKATTKKRSKKERLADSMATIRVQRDTTAADSNRKRYFIGYHHVRIFSDSLQGSCDSISYSQQDSVMRMMKNPVAWSRNSQITGDTILLYTDSGKIKQLYVPNNGLIVSRSGPEKAGLFDQVQGKSITGYFFNNAIREMIVKPNAESIYYTKDDAGAYLGSSQSSSERMRVIFKDNKIQLIILGQDVKQSLTPMLQVNFGTNRLSRFQWLEERRPKTLAELFQ